MWGTDTKSWICYTDCVLVYFFSHVMNDKMRSLFCFCLVCILSVFSISVFLAPLWSRAHFCFVSLNIALIVALTEVKPPLISFVYIVGDTERGRERERESVLERRRGCDSDCSVWQRPGPVGVGRRERRLVFCLWQSGKSCHGESLGLPSGFLRLFCTPASQPLRSSLLRGITHTVAEAEQTMLLLHTTSLFCRHLR